MVCVCVCVCGRVDGCVWVCELCMWVCVLCMWVCVLCMWGCVVWMSVGVCGACVYVCMCPTHPSLPYRVCVWMCVLGVYVWVCVCMRVYGCVWVCAQSTPASPIVYVSYRGTICVRGDNRYSRFAENSPVYVSASWSRDQYVIDPSL